LNGSDQLGNGTEIKPFRSLQMAANQLNENITNFEILIRKSKELYELAPKTAIKKALKALKNQLKKEEKNLLKSQKEKMDILETALVEDKSLPTASKIKLYQAEINRGNRVKVNGWIHRVRKQKDMIFIILRDGHGYIQCILTGDQCKTIDATNLTLESTIVVYGTIMKLPEGKYVSYYLLRLLEDMNFNVISGSCFLKHQMEKTAF
jgi:asparaginyl-tRNA synthetase